MKTLSNTSKDDPPPPQTNANVMVAVIIIAIIWLILFTWAIVVLVVYWKNKEIPEWSFIAGIVALCLGMPLLSLIFIYIGYFIMKN